MLAAQAGATTSAALDRESRFDSIAGFVDAIKAFEPAQASSWMAYQFSAVELGQPEEESTGSIVRAPHVLSCATLWNNEDTAVVFATAEPPTSATRSTVGVLFLLHSYDKKWRIVDEKKFTAAGRFASVDGKLTAGADSDRALDPEGVVITVTESHGGAGLSYQLSSSFRISGASLVRADLE